MSPTSPAAPSLVFSYSRPVSALLIRTGYLENNSWTESAGVRAVAVIGLDAAPVEAVRALVEFREGSTTRRAWVAVADLARTPAAAAEKMRAHFSALLNAQRLEKKAVTTTASKAEAISTEAKA